MVKKSSIKKLKHKSRRLSIKEGMFAAASGSVGNTYISPFAIAINASNSLVALLSSISGLLGPLTQMFSSKLIEKYSRKKIILKFIHHYLIKDRGILPYEIKTSDIHEMAYLHCELMENLTNSKPISAIEVSTFGGPLDIFEINGRKYTMPFLNLFC